VFGTALNKGLDFVLQLTEKVVQSAGSLPSELAHTDTRTIVQMIFRSVYDEVRDVGEEYWPTGRSPNILSSDENTPMMTLRVVFAIKKYGLVFKGH
jgi:hypothetical protein